MQEAGFHTLKHASKQLRLKKNSLLQISHRGDITLNFPASRRQGYTFDGYNEQKNRTDDNQMDHYFFALPQHCVMEYLAQDTASFKAANTTNGHTVRPLEGKPFTVPKSNLYISDDDFSYLVPDRKTN